MPPTNFGSSPKPAAAANRQGEVTAATQKTTKSAISRAKAG